MVEINAEMIKTLRHRTGIGMGKCKEALQAAHGDIELAIANLRKAGIASAVKKEGRQTNEGMICVAETHSTMVVIEVNAETDFVVKNERFQEFAHNLAKEACDSSATNIEDFLNQSYTKDPTLTLDQYRSTIVEGLGENIRISRLKRFSKKIDSTLAFYSHQGGQIVTIVEIAGSSHLGQFGKEIAMHIAAEAPDYISPQKIPDHLIEQEKEIARAQIKGKPESIVNKILEGKLNAFFDQVCLLNQKFIKNGNLTIQQLLATESKKIESEITISHFLRWKVGEYNG
ncbi:MAG: translation elongation factor Ts [Chlamydiales bacterium]